MKVILSRKGFDSSNGGCASPIMPDGTMLSMPIPSDDDAKFSDLHYNGVSYADLIKSLNSKFTAECCHVDPDIRNGIRKTDIPKWQPAFGQISAAQTSLKNAEVNEGDLFLFFGWFRHVKETNNGYKYVTRRDSKNFYDHADLHMIYGYMQIGKIITNPEEIKKYTWHPHSGKGYVSTKTNALYIPADKLSFNSSMPGYGTLDYHEKRVLTMKDRTRAIWNNYDFYSPDMIHDNRKNSDKKGGLYYAGVWQELVINESEALTEWAKKILC